MTANEWEVVDDDGFIYKRRKRKAVLPAPVPIINHEPVLSEQAQLCVREKLTRRKKMAVLLAQKEMYAAEIADWEIISKRQEESLASAPIFQSPPSPEQPTVHSLDDATSDEDLQMLEVQVEAYEAFIEHLKSLRDQAESMCKKLEMNVEASRVHVEQDMFKEVVKFTPRTIIQSLTSDSALPLPVADLPAKSLLGRLMTNDYYDGGQAQEAERS